MPLAAGEPGSKTKGEKNSITMGEKMKREDVCSERDDWEGREPVVGNQQRDIMKETKKQEDKKEKRWKEHYLEVRMLYS